MKIGQALILCLLMLTAKFLFAQDNDKKGSRNYTGIDLGIGAGLDYGGIGGRVTIIPLKSFGIFASCGYVLVGMGYNVGANIIFKSERKTLPYITGMYGYNGVINVKGDIQFRKIYYGPTFGMGLKRLLRHSNNSLNLEVLIPLRDEEFHNKVSDLKRQGTSFNFIPPFAISIGFHFGPTR